MGTTFTLMRRLKGPTILCLQELCTLVDPAKITRLIIELLKIQTSWAVLRGRHPSMDISTAQPAHDLVAIIMPP